MNKFDRGSQGDSTYQISKLYTFWFQRRRVSKMVFFGPIFQLVTLRAGPVLAPGHHMNKLGRGLQEDATSQIRRRFSFFFFLFCYHGNQSY